MANIVNVTQEQWDELTSMLQLAAQQAELRSKEREGLAVMLTQACEALKEAKDDAQAADQRSHELMGLYGWAGITPGSASGGGTKVEIGRAHV